MKKVLKWIGIGILAIIAFLVLDVIVYVIFGSSLLNNSSNNQSQQTQQEENTELTPEQEYLQQDTSKITPENLNLEYEISRGLNLNGQIEPKLESEYMTPEQKIEDADEIYNRIDPIFEALNKLKDEDNEYQSAATHAWGAYLSLSQECNLLKSYAQTGSEEDKTKFFELNENAREEFYSARENLMSLNNQ